MPTPDLSSQAPHSRAPVAARVLDLYNADMVERSFVDQSIPGNKLTNLSLIPAGVGM